MRILTNGTLLEIVLKDGRVILSDSRYGWNFSCPQEVDECLQDTGKYMVSFGKGINDEVVYARDVETIRLAAQQKAPISENEDLVGKKLWYAFDTIEVVGICRVCPDTRVVVTMNGNRHDTLPLYYTLEANEVRRWLERDTHVPILKTESVLGLGKV